MSSQFLLKLYKNNRNNISQGSFKNIFHLSSFLSQCFLFKSSHLKDKKHFNMISAKLNYLQRCHRVRHRTSSKEHSEDIRQLSQPTTSAINLLRLGWEILNVLKMRIENSMNKKFNWKIPWKMKTFIRCGSEFQIFAEKIFSLQIAFSNWQEFSNKSLPSNAQFMCWHVWKTKGFAYYWTIDLIIRQQHKRMSWDSHN